ncbi:MAG: hypothetical protein HYV09_36295 [Deltaproteobacteria bacterium]|nr:hypothetical protein [Deltaproteobacteria bacterium]
MSDRSYYLFEDDRLLIPDECLWSASLSDGQTNAISCPPSEDELVAMPGWGINIHSSSTHFFWELADRRTLTPVVVRTPRGGGRPTIVAKDLIFWAAHGDDIIGQSQSTGTLKQYSISTGITSNLAPKDLWCRDRRCGRVRITGSHIYWTMLRADREPIVTSVARMPRSGGEAIAVTNEVPWATDDNLGALDGDQWLLAGSSEANVIEIRALDLGADVFPTAFPIVATARLSGDPFPWSLAADGACFYVSVVPKWRLAGAVVKIARE